MKATGIVRRIDDLGRVVVPKEIRRTLRIREGDPLEIYTSAEGSIVLKKYSPIVELSEFAEEFSRVLESTLNVTAIICDKEMVIAASGIDKKQYHSRKISKQLEIAMEKRIPQLNQAEIIPVFESEEKEGIHAQFIRPILSDGFVIGAIVLNGKEASALGEAAQRSAEVAALFMGMQME